MIKLKSKDINLIEELDQALKAYNYDLLNKQPLVMKDLYDYFYKHINPIFNYCQLLFEDNVLCVENEIRAFFGHITDYIQSGYDDRRNFEKAYGHFRRLNLDIFKIICNELDRSIYQWIVKHSYYDYRNANSIFLNEFSKLYFSAKNLYAKSQKEECVGHDSEKHNVLELYCKAAQGYVQATLYYAQNSEVIGNAELRANLMRAGSIFLYALGIVSGTLGFIL